MFLGFKGKGMTAAETMDDGDRKWRVHPVAIWLGACLLVWGLIGAGLFSVAPIGACLAFLDEDAAPFCETALHRPLATGSWRVALLRRQADILIAKDKHDEALPHADEIIASGQAIAADHERRGKIFSYRGEGLRSAAAYREALQLDPDNEDYFTSLMAASYSAGTFADARRDGDAFIASHPQSATGYSWRGWADYRDGQYGAASVNLRIAAAKDASNAAFQNELAMSLEKEGKTDEALAFYGKAIALDAPNETYLLNRAWLFQDLKREGEAQGDFRKMLELNRSTETLLRLARSHLTEAQYDLAAPLIEEALKQSPDDADAHVAKIRLLYYRDEYAQARAAVAALQKIWPDNKDAIYWLASIDDDEKQPEKALKGYMSLLGAWEKDAGLRNSIGHVLVDLQRYPEAVSYFTEAIRLAPEDASGYGGRARAYGYLEDWKASLADANTAISLDAKSGVSYARRANAEWWLKDMAAAGRDYEKATALLPQTIWVAEEQAEFLIDDGQWSVAEEKINTLLAKWPDSAKAKELQARLAEEKPASAKPP
jgi:tetratricopeptide (TPR) repeat protein